MRVVRAALWLVAGGALGTLTHAGETRWLKLTSPHFEMYTQAGERSSRDALARFEQVRSFFTQSLGSGRDFLRKRVRVVAFGSSREYEPLRHRATAAAYYVSALGRDYIVLGGIGGDVLPVAMHEYVHLVIQHSGFEIPLWLNEGLAELYST